MKKIFLSLSAIALLAVGTVSCGSDDSSPAPVELASSINYDGVDYEVDATRGYVYTNQQNQIIAYNVNIGGSTVQCTKWAILSFSGETFTETTPNYVLTEIYIPVSGNSAVYPEDATTMYLASDIEATVESVVIASATTDFNFEIANWDTEAEVAKFVETVVFENGKTLTLNFDGFLDAYYALPQAPAPAGAAKSNKNLVKEIQSATTKMTSKELQVVK